MGLIVFLLVFLFLYSAMHALVFWGVHPLLSGHPALPSLVLSWMALMVISPVLVRVLDRLGSSGAARILAWVGYSWMGFVFLAFCAFALVGAWHLLALLLAKLQPAWPLLTLHRPAGSAGVLLIVLTVGLYGYFEALHLRTEKVRIVSEKIPLERGSLRIVQVSDLHLGILHHEETLAPVISAIQELKPDLLVATGDMVDAQMDHLNGLSELWGRLNPPMGKFAVTGNHEVYAGLGQSIHFLDRSGFKVLRNEMAKTGGIQIAGVDDPALGPHPEETAVLRSGDPTLFTILLKHRPVIRDEAVPLFDLQLSGHAHRGQIFPFNFVTALAYPLQNGLYTLAGGSHLYTSRGTGAWGPPMRVLSPPEVTLFEVDPAPPPLH